MMLFGDDVMGRGRGAESPLDVQYVEPELALGDALDVARNYGVETAGRYQVVGQVTERIRDFVASLVAIHGFGADEAELLRNYAWAGVESSGALIDFPF